MDSANNVSTDFQWQDIRKKQGYTIYQTGSHIRGNFIQVFVPDSPCCNQQGKRKLITYLHGFGLCLPKFYEQHLETLAQQGYYVFFPDFQNSDYPDELDQDNLHPSHNKRHLYFWYQMVIDTITRKQTSSEDKFNKQKRKAREFFRIRETPQEPSALKCFLVALALVIIILIIRLIYIFSPQYRKNLVKLISTVGLSLLYSPEVWINRAINMTSDSWDKVREDNPELKTIDFDFYVFGHSLGGLLALSWPAYVNNHLFSPKQILTADPAPSTEMGIPQIAIFVLKILGSPFTSAPIRIRETGLKLQIPVGIMHGADDNIVRPESWIGRSLWDKQTNFDYIASANKKIYFSLSQKQDQPPLIAFHNQAVTDTTYFSDALFKNFGGVKDQPNAYNYEYIWPGLNLVLENKVEADDLLKKFPLKTINVTDNFTPAPANFTWLKVLGGIALLGLIYWFFSGNFALG